MCEISPGFRIFTTEDTESTEKKSSLHQFVAPLCALCALCGESSFRGSCEYLHGLSVSSGRQDASLPPRCRLRLRRSRSLGRSVPHQGMEKKTVAPAMTMAAMDISRIIPRRGRIGARWRICQIAQCVRAKRRPTPAAMTAWPRRAVARGPSCSGRVVPRSSMRSRGPRC